MTAHVLRVRTDGPAAAARHLPILASLPDTFRTADDPSALSDVTLVDGTRSGWIATAADASWRARLVIVDRPRPDSGSRRPDSLPGDLPPNVVAGIEWVDAPGVAAALPEVRTRDAALVESLARVATPAELADALLAQLVLLRALLGPVEMHSVAGAADRSHVLGGRAAGGPVLSLSAAVGPPGLELTVAGAADRWRIALPDPATARPAVVARDHAAGTHRGRPVFESPRRALWRTVAAALHGDGAGLVPLAALAPDLSVVGRALASPETE